MVEVEKLAEQPETCRVSLDAAIQIGRPLLTELSNPQSVLYQVSAERLAGLPTEDLLGISTLLLTDPSKSGVVVERWRLQGGRLPEDAVDDNSPEKTVLLWASEAAKIPPLKLPVGMEADLMTLADKLQMRGSGPIIYSREHIERYDRSSVEQMQKLPRTLLKIDGAANLANVERIKSALSYVEVHSIEQPIVATVDPFRILKDQERDKVSDFAPDATNELELFVDSAILNGFRSSEQNRYGVRFLPDRSSYLEMFNENGTKLVVLAPPQQIRADGSKQSGVYNGYNSLINNPKVVSEDFSLAGSDLIQVTSSHYGPMAVMNNFRAVNDLRVTLDSYRVIGDNQVSRTAQAHLIEIGLTANALLEAVANPRFAEALQE